MELLPEMCSSHVALHTTRPTTWQAASEIAREWFSARTLVRVVRHDSGHVAEEARQAEALRAVEEMELGPMSSISEEALLLGDVPADLLAAGAAHLNALAVAEENGDVPPPPSPFEEEANAFGGGAFGRDARARPRRPGAVADDRGGASTGGSKTVSYTHLTLPTKRIV